MKIEKGNIVTLNNDIKYIVLSKVNYKGNDYIYLTSMEEDSKIKICCEKTTEGVTKLSVVNDVELIKELVLLFDADIQSIL